MPRIQLAPLSAFPLPHPEEEGSETGHLPGEPGVWLFVTGDMVMFGLFFAAFVHGYVHSPDLYRSSQAHLDQSLGVLNTALLLTSSWFVASAVASARSRRSTTSSGLFLLAFACGLGFLVVKFLEWRDKLRAGLTLTTNDFFMYYFVFCGIHLVHVLVGLGVLLFMIRHARGPMDARRIHVIESGATYWHMVDTLWIGLFGLLYLLK
jgi:nitric oxide reductase NorE protein